MRAYIITGTTRGLGKIFLEILSEKNMVVSISRSHAEVQKNVKQITCDLSEIESVKKIEFFTKNELTDINDVIFINNAGMIEPISEIGKLDADRLETSMNVNLMAPMVLINNLVAQVDKKLTVLNISTGAADHPIDGWSAYCTAKAGMKMFCEVLDAQGIRAISVDPGVMDTDMQKTVRNTKFSKQNDFISFQKKGQLQKPEDVARRILKEYGI